MDQGFEVKPGGGRVRVPLGAAFTPGARVRYPNTVPAGHCCEHTFFKYPRQLSGIKLTTESLRAHHLF